jgi:hypothetical protein
LYDAISFSGNKLFVNVVAHVPKSNGRLSAFNDTPIKEACFRDKFVNDCVACPYTKEVGSGVPVSSFTADRPF